MITYVPNLLTLARLTMIPWLVVLLQQQDYVMALAVFLIAGVSDALDGFIAKRFNARTQLGAILDPLADKALMVSAFVMLTLSEIIPFWLMVVVVFRDIVIIAGFLIMYLLFGSIKMQPLKSSKLNTCVQVVYVLAVLLGLAMTALDPILLQALSYLVLITSVWSGVAYVVIWSFKSAQDPDQVKYDANEHR